MFVNYTNKHLFIHIPKTGGTSIHKCYIDKYEDTFVNSTKKWSENNIEKINGHIFMKELLKIENFTDFNSFAVVRNPYELVISHYFFSKMKYNYSDSFDDFI